MGNIMKRVIAFCNSMDKQIAQNTGVYAASLSIDYSQTQSLIPCTQNLGMCIQYIQNILYTYFIVRFHSPSVVVTLCTLIPPTTPDPPTTCTLI